jgi:hypothetical protein
MTAIGRLEAHRAVRSRFTRMVTDVTYDAITADFWANLDAIGSQETWKMFVAADA